MKEQLIEKKDSRRVKMTKKILKETLLDIMADKNISHISIKEICELADVNRSTFYAHYDSIQDLLIEIENDVINETPRINLYYDEPVLEELTTFFKYLERNKDVCRILFASSDQHSFETKIMDKLFGKTSDKPQWITGFDIHNDVHIKMLMSAFGGLAIVEKWISGDFDCTADELAIAISGAIQGKH